MIQEYQLRILPEIAVNEQKLKEYLSKEKGLNLRDITATRILKRSIDARQRTIFVNLKVRAYINEMPQEDEYEQRAESCRLPNHGCRKRMVKSKEKVPNYRRQMEWRLRKAD